MLEALSRFGPGSHDAVDLGCGAGIDTLGILERGWRVFATDAEAEGIRRLRSRVPAELTPALRTTVARMEQVELPEADLIWAGFSLFILPTAAMVGGLAEGTRRGPSRWPVRRPDPGRTGHLGARPRDLVVLTRTDPSPVRRIRDRTLRGGGEGRRGVHGSEALAPLPRACPRDRVRTAGRDTASAHRLVTLDARPSGLPTWARPSRVTEVDR